MKRPTNSGPARGISTTDPNAASWAALDSLPHELREILWGAPVSINPLSAEQLARVGEQYARDALVSAIAEELARFDAQHQREHGHPLPTVAAAVQPLRYGAAIIRTRRRRFAIPQPHRRRLEPRRVR